MVNGIIGRCIILKRVKQFNYIFLSCNGKSESAELLNSRRFLNWIIIVIWCSPAGNGRYIEVQMIPCITDPSVTSHRLKVRVNAQS